MVGYGEAVASHNQSHQHLDTVGIVARAAKGSKPLRSFALEADKGGIEEDKFYSQ
jgi:hypothetical protein